MAGTKTRLQTTGTQRQQTAKILEAQQSTHWHLYHALCYCVGGFLFLGGSILFYPAIYDEPGADFAAACLWILGSAAFLVADLTEWEHVRVCDKRCGDTYNSLLSAFGSAVYVVGSSLYVPTWERFYWGGLLYVIGSGIICISQTIRLIRAALAAALLADIPGAIADFLNLLGGFWFLISSTCSIGVTGFCKLNIVATMYTVGAFCFTAASFAMQYRYFLAAASSKTPDRTIPSPLSSGLH